MSQDLDVKTKVKRILEAVQEIAPGRSVELRIPPYAAIQCVGGSTHRRGTPPNVVEMSPEILIALSKNPEKWEDFRELGMVLASGTHSNLSNLFIEVSKLCETHEKERNAQ